MMTNLLFSQLTAIGKRFAMVLTMLVMLGVTQAWGYTITFSTGNNTGTKASTSTTCASLVSEGSNYLTGNLQTATNVYPTTSNNLRIGNSNATGTLKMNLSNNGKVNATTIIVKAKQYTSDKGKTLTVNGSQAQTPANNWGDLTFTINADITYIELVASGYLYVQSITINTNGGESGDNATCGWIETDISNISSTDDVVITMTNGTTTWALTNGNGTSKAPAATTLTMNTDGSISENPKQISDAILWNISTSNNTLTISPKENPSIWLYVNNDTGNNVRVGNAVNANSNGTFIIEGNYLKNVTKSYYIGVYNNSDWRCYANTTGNIAGQTLKFYKYVACGSTQPTHTVTLHTDGGTINAGNVTNYTEGVGATLPTNVTKTGYTFAGWYNNNGFTGDPIETIGTNETGNKEFWAKWTINQYTVTLNPNYPNGKTGTFTYDAGELVDGNLVLTYDYNTASMTIEDLYTSLTLDGYEFGGWYNAKGENPGEVSGSKCTTTGTITGNKTYFAKWSKLYSITLSENGTTTELDAQTSTSYTLPTELSAGSCQDDTKELVGWSTVAIPNPRDKPTSNFYELGETVTLTADQTTFYAVFATGSGGGGEGWTAVTSTSDLEAGATYAISSAATEGTYLSTWDGGNNFPGSTSIICPLILGGSAGAWTFQIADGDTYNNRFLTATNTTEKNYLKAVTTADAYSVFTISFDANNKDAVITCTGKASRNILRYNANNGSPIFACYSSGQSPVYLQKYASATTYSDYSTSCVALPDPVISFVTTPADPIVFDPVNCGSTTSKAQAKTVQVSGENLRDVVNVSVTGPYKIARTASTDLKDFTTSLTLDKTAAGAIHSNYQTVYIISTPPAQSTEATMGTLTFTTTKGNTLNVNLSTPTVTCTQYTLTLVDRGVSTEQPTKYYAGETIDEAPTDPEGVCTDPIHYVFDGWATASVAAGATTYTKVTFPYTVEGNTKFYAVYRYLEGGGNGDYNLVTSALDDWSGDYLIAYSDEIFANGKIGGKDGIGAAGEKVDLSSYITNNTIPAAEGDKYKVSLEAINGGYLLKTQDGQYNYQASNNNGLEATTNKNTATNYKLSVNFVSFEEINLCLSGNAEGAIFQYNTGQQGYFRFYKNGGQNPVYLYKKADGTTYYTTSPICGPHLAITEGKDIYVTGGNADGTRDLVIAQQKVSYKATRLNVGPTSQVPDVKVATNGITVGGVVTSDVKVTIDQTKEQQTDGTYTITGTVTVQYQPSANNKQENIQVQLAVDYNAEARDNFTVHARSLPSEFVIVAKSGDKWYALNGDMNNGSSANPANGQVTLNNDDNPTKATYAPCNTIYTFDGLPNTGDRTYVRFQGTDGAWLWASSGTNVGIQNNVLKTTPEGNNNAYNWKLYTEDNITYRFGNANSSRQLTLSGEKFGMYASGVQDIRILPYEAKCLYNYAPTNLKVSVLKGTYVTLTWDAVPSATKYQYRTNATNWTDCGTEPTATINGLKGVTEYTYYIRAYHEDAGVSKECIDYAEITFTTANCDDVPTDITYSADLNSITVSWTAAAPTATIKYNTKEDGTGGGGIINNATSPYTISGGLDPNTTYYIQILAGGTCASPIIPVKTEDVEVDIVEWMTDGIIVDINTDETVGVTLENEVSFGSGLGTEATELFFSKYYEASYHVKLVAIYNGTKNIIDLTDYTIQYGKTEWEDNYITLKNFGATKGQIQPGEEIILYSMRDGTEDDDIMDCVHDAFPDGNWVRVTGTNNDGHGTLSFGGDKTIILCKTEYDDEEDKYYDYIIDVIGALKNDPNEGLLPSTTTEKPSWGDNKGWVCATGLSIADDSQIGISTNRCLLIRNNTVTSGENAVTQNIDDFVTLCSEWKGAHVPDNDTDNGVQASCDNFAYVGTFDYSDYYTKYVPMDDEDITFNRNDDGTVTIKITDLYKHACSNIRVKLTNSNSEVLSDREYKVPIMITKDQETAYTDENKNQNAFYALQENLATVEVDNEGNPTGNKTNLTLEQVREICKTCDVVVRDKATLTKVTDGTTNDHPQVHDVIVYEGASIVIPDGEDHNYTINSLSLRRKGDTVASAQVQGTGKLVLPADVPVTLNMRIDANNWHWFTLPYDCDIADVTWSDGTPAKYGTDWFLMYYDGESRAASTNPRDNHWKKYNESNIEAGKGYIIGITGNLAHPDYTFELRFPMEQDVLTAEQTNKTVAVNAWGVKSDNTPNNKGWNLVGNPYLNYYKTADEYSLAGLSLIHYINTDPVTGEWNYENSGSAPYLVIPQDGGMSEYKQELASEVNMMPFTAYFVQVGDPNTHENGHALNASFEASNRGKKSILRRAQSEVDDLEEPAIVAVSLTNAKGESDKTTLLIADRFTNEYEMNADFFKWFGDYYTYYTKPVLYTIGADNESRAFNALNEQLAAQPVELGMYAAQAGNYTFSLNQRSNLTGVAEVWLHDANSNTHTNLMQDDYSFSTAKTNGAGRFSLSVKMASKVTTAVDNITAQGIWATTQDNQIIINGLAKDLQVWIYDATGKLLHADHTTNYQHSYSVPTSGVYFVRVNGQAEAQTIKIVVE